jgi:hypothetical protein
MAPLAPEAAANVSYTSAMSRRTVEGTAHSTADPGTVYAVLRDRPTWPDWSPLKRYEFVSGTEGELDSVCVFITNGVHSVERIVELVADRRLSYALVSGLPMRDYRADVDLTPATNADGTMGTDITWRSSFEPKIPATGWFFGKMMGQLVPRMARALAVGAQQRAVAR